MAADPDPVPGQVEPGWWGFDALTDPREIPHAVPEPLSRDRFWSHPGLERLWEAENSWRNSIYGNFKKERGKGALWSCGELEKKKKKKRERRENIKNQPKPAAVLGFKGHLWA